jgi:hypothetical protein
MSSESVCQVARSWVDVGSFLTSLFGVVYVTCGDAAARRRLHSTSPPKMKPYCPGSSLVIWHPVTFFISKNEIEAERMPV